MVVAGAIFFAVGLIASSIGPVLPELALNTGSRLSEVGSLFAALFLGGIVSQVAAGPLVDRMGHRSVLVVSLALLAAGVAGVALSKSLLMAVAAMLVAGLGDGAIIVIMNLMVSQVFAPRSVAALNLLNVFFGLGAIAGPAFASLSLRVWGTSLTVLWLVAFVTLLQVPLVAYMKGVPVGGPVAGAEAADVPIYRSRLLWAFGLLLLLYVGIEIGTGGWTITYVDRTTGLGLEGAALVASGFWLALTGGRVAAGVLGVRLLPNTVLLASLLGAVAGSLTVALSTGNAFLTTAGILLLGFSLGPVFPTVAAMVSTEFSRAPGKSISVVVALGSAGGMLLPWAQGVLLEASGPVAGVLFVAGGTLLMLLIYGLVRSLQDQEMGKREPAGNAVRVTLDAAQEVER